MLKKLAARNLPPLLVMNDGTAVKSPDDWRVRRRELLDMLSREEYGYTPASPAGIRAEIESTEPTFAGKATRSVVRIAFDTPGGEFSFPFTLIVPAASKPVPAFVIVAFKPDVPNPYLPAEEIIDHGFAIANMCYQDVTSDTAALDGIAAMYPRSAPDSWGKIGMWAFAASRVMDYLETRADIDPAHVCVTGHSRLGKTALWCAAQDERFAMAISNDSGCSGAAISRGKVGESIDAITDPERFHYWFCENYRAWANREYDAPFDQHMLLSLIAPRRLYVCSAEEDQWADPESEYLGALAADEAWKLLRCPGLIAGEGMPAANAPLHEGGIAYHLRTGSHFHSRTDWLHHMAYREKHHV